ncbi:hypothetical protein N0B44_02205 [Roseibacterium beibuensis]|uniref:Uncharacterized protein n=1 Tax=[Roseibacterium] beibuensis TaxID=1193142 RepID=A0ABP9L1Z4_9RHOB|nr:hypothetical protein [Roseibacterium beibuensis]MCS6621715.1 hypothetical protein [Roseibacterium beibuensis]
MASQVRPEDLEDKIARLLMTQVAGSQVAERLKQADAGWHDRAAMADLRSRRVEALCAKELEARENVIVLRRAAG